MQIQVDIRSIHHLYKVIRAHKGRGFQTDYRGIRKQMGAAMRVSDA